MSWMGKYGRWNVLDGEIWVVDCLGWEKVIDVLTSITRVYNIKPDGLELVFNWITSHQQAACI